MADDRKSLTQPRTKVAVTKRHRGPKFAPAFLGNKGRPINSIRNLTRRITGEQRENEAAAAKAAKKAAGARA